MQYPKHVALIPDGNRTWAKELWKTSLEWHLEWFQRCIELAIHIFENTTIDVFTLRWLSTENLKNRTKIELSYLFDLYKKITENLYDMMHKNHVNFRFAGDKTQLPKHLIDFINEKESEFVFPDSSKTFVLAVNYGWQDEILRAMKKLADSWYEITKENLEKYMDFGWLPTVDLVIRTKQIIWIYASTNWICSIIFYRFILSSIHNRWIKQSYSVVEWHTMNSEFRKIIFKLCIISPLIFWHWFFISSKPISFKIPTYNQSRHSLSISCRSRSKFRHKFKYCILIVPMR